MTTNNLSQSEPKKVTKTNFLPHNIDTDASDHQHFHIIMLYRKKKKKQLVEEKYSFCPIYQKPYFHISESIWFASHYKLQNSVSDINQNMVFYFVIFFNFMKIYLQQEHLATNLNFPLIKLEKFVHSHLNLFICLSLLFFPNQTFLL